MPGCSTLRGESPSRPGGLAEGGCDVGGKVQREKSEKKRTARCCQREGREITTTTGEGGKEGCLKRGQHRAEGRPSPKRVRDGLKEKKPKGSCSGQTCLDGRSPPSSGNTSRRRSSGFRPVRKKKEAALPVTGEERSHRHHPETENYHLNDKVVYNKRDPISRCRHRGPEYVGGWETQGVFRMSAETSVGRAGNHLN